MGYGHLRPAHALAAACGGEVLECDQAPLASEWERRVWDRSRALYERLCRGAGLPVVGRPLRGLLDGLTAIGRPGPRGSQTRPSRATRYVAGLVREGLGGGLVARLRAEGAPLLTTFYAPAIAADAAGVADVVCVATDVDVHRVWVAEDPGRSRIRYAVPARRTARRLLAYGVDPARVAVTGFPLPPALVGPGGATRDRLLEERLRRLEAAAAGRGPLHVVLAIGGAGAQRPLAAATVAALAADVARGAVRLTVVAGTRADTARALSRAFARSGVDRLVGQGLSVLGGTAFAEYEARFEEALAGADALWTKPSEMVFFGALGLPLLLAPPLGCQERANRVWALRRGAALDAPRPRAAAAWLAGALREGALVRAARAGAARMTAGGTDAVLAWAGAKIPSGFRPGGPSTTDTLLRSPGTPPRPSEPVPE
jgi:hypothetical protein